MPNYYFHFASTQSPTQFNIRKQLISAGFKSTTDANQADFSDKNLTLNEEYTQLLEYKHLLAALTQQYCPEVMPLTYIIDDNNYSDVMHLIAQQHYQQHKKSTDHRPDLAWILKPALLNNGEGIQLFNCLSDIKAHFQGTARYSSFHVLQQYILQPHLLNGHKYTFRMFVIITNFAGVYLYKNGYFNVGRKPYDVNNFADLGVHLTNEHLNPDHTPNIWQIPTKQCPNFDIIYQKMQNIIRKIIHALNMEVPALLTDHKNEKAFSLFGFDFMLDEQLNLWLLEVNHAPCFPKDKNHVLQKYLYDEFWQTLFHDFIKPIVENNDRRIGQSSLLVAMLH